MPSREAFPAILPSVLEFRRLRVHSLDLWVSHLLPRQSDVGDLKGNLHRLKACSPLITKSSIESKVFFVLNKDERVLEDCQFSR